MSHIKAISASFVQKSIHMLKQNIFAGIIEISLSHIFRKYSIYHIFHVLIILPHFKSEKVKWNIITFFHFVRIYPIPHYPINAKYNLKSIDCQLLTYFIASNIQWLILSKDIIKFIDTNIRDGIELFIFR